MTANRMTAAQRRQAAGFTNVHDILKAALAAGVGPNVAVVYVPTDRAGVYFPARWRVIHPGYKTNPEPGFWRDYGNKAFEISQPEERQARLADAMEWASDRYDVPAWDRLPGFPYDYLPAAVVAWAKQRLAEVSTEG